MAERKTVTSDEHYILSGKAIQIATDPYVEFTGIIPKSHIRGMIDIALCSQDFRTGMTFLIERVSWVWSQRQTDNLKIQGVLEKQFAEMHKLYFRREGIFRTSKESLRKGLVNRPNTLKPISDRQLNRLGFVVSVIEARQKRWNDEMKFHLMEPQRWEDDGGK